jgi:hypothetical protein
MAMGEINIDIFGGLWQQAKQELQGMWDSLSSLTESEEDKSIPVVKSIAKAIEQPEVPVVLEAGIFDDTTDSTLVEDLGSEDLESPVISIDSAIDSVEAAFPSNGMLSEIATVESRRGEDPNTYREGYHGGIMQVDEVGFKDTQNVKSHPKLKGKFKKIKEEFGIDWTKTTWENLRDPLHSAIAARLFLSNKSGEIPKTVEGRAAYWKEKYNTVKGKGSSKEYLERLKQ